MTQLEAWRPGMASGEALIHLWGSLAGKIVGYVSPIDVGDRAVLIAGVDPDKLQPWSPGRRSGTVRIAASDVVLRYGGPHPCLHNIRQGRLLVMHLRPAARSDLATLEGLLLEAVNWCPDRPQLTLEDLNGNDMLVRYVEEWPRDDDVGVIAEDDYRVVGAAWFRRFARDRPGFGFIDELTPEVSVAVDPGCRGRGVGSQLLGALIAIGRNRGFERLSLSVESQNRAVNLYRRLGFVVAHDEIGSSTMRLDL